MWLIHFIIFYFFSHLLLHHTNHQLNRIFVSWFWRPWISKQLLFEYCSCLPELLFKGSIVADISLTFSISSLIICSFSSLSRSNSSSFSQIKLILLFKSIRCCLLLIWIIFVSFALLWIPCICFSTLLIQLYKPLTQSGEDNLSPNIIKVVEIV